MRILNFLIILLLFLQCSFNQTDRLIFQECQNICNELQIKKCEIEINRLNNSDKNQSKNEIVIKIQDSENIDSLYKQKPNLLSGIISYRLFRKLKGLNINSEFSIIKIKNHKKINIYEIEKLKTTENAFKIIDNFFDFSRNNQFDKLFQLIDKNVISYDKFQQINKAYNELSFQNPIKKIVINGIDYKKTTNNENVILLNCFVEHIKSRDNYIFYLMTNTMKIAHIEIMSDISPLELKP